MRAATVNFDVDGAWSGATRFPAAGASQLSANHRETLLLLRRILAR